MLPKTTDDLRAEFNMEDAKTHPDKTFHLDFTRGRIVNYVDGREAIEQAIRKALNTERYEYLAYGWDYGAEINKLFGQPIPYVYSELKRLITEALMQDDRIISVEAFNFSHVKHRVLVEFTVNTTEGELRMEQEVRV